MENPLERFLGSIFETLVNCPHMKNNLIRKHTCRLEDLGEVSFPIELKSWSQFINPYATEGRTIFKYRLLENDTEKGLEKLLKSINYSGILVKTHKIIKNSVHLYLDRTTLFTKIICQVLNKNEFYGHTNFIATHFTLITSENIQKESSLNLTALRLVKLKKVIENVLKCVSNLETNNTKKLYLSIQHEGLTEDTVLCGPVINELGVKENQNTSEDLCKKRIDDIRKMFEHKYGKKASENIKLEQYFEKLGKACITLELLKNNPHKTLKIDLKKDTNRGILFVFYNCARITTLFKEYQQKVYKNLYPPMCHVKEIDFSLLKEPEEWELFYVYILQYPLVIKSCIQDVEQASVNPQHLVTFLCNLSSVFSTYYRRVRILVEPRDHLIPVIQARMCLLRALQCVFYNALNIFDIEPVKEM